MNWRDQIVKLLLMSEDVEDGLRAFMIFIFMLLLYDRVYG